MLKKVTLILLPVLALLAMTSCAVDPTDVPIPQDPINARVSPGQTLLQAQTPSEIAQRDFCGEYGTVILNRESEECPLLIATSRGQLLAPMNIKALPQGLRDGLTVTMAYRIDRSAEPGEICDGVYPARFACMTIVGFEDKPRDVKQF